MKLYYKPISIGYLRLIGFDLSTERIDLSFLFLDPGYGRLISTTRSLRHLNHLFVIDGSELFDFLVLNLIPHSFLVFLFFTRFRLLGLFQIFSFAQLLVTFEVSDICSAKVFILLYDMSDRIVINTVLIDQILNMHSVYLAVINDGNSLGVCHSFVPFLVPLSLRYFLVFPTYLTWLIIKLDNYFSFHHVW